MHLLICVVMFDMRDLASIRAVQESALCFQNAGNLKLLQGRCSLSGKHLALSCDVRFEASNCSITSTTSRSLAKLPKNYKLARFLTRI